MNNIIIYFFAFCFFFAGTGVAQQFDGPSEAIYALNSPYSEEFLAIHPSGDRLAFSRANHPYNQGGRFDEGDIWISRWDSIWQTPENWHMCNSDQYSSPIGWSSDGQTFLYNRVSTKGGVLTTEIWAVSGDVRDQQNIAYFKNKSRLQSACISADNRIMIISMESGATSGVEDLYLIRREGSSWSAPKNLGSGINTPFQEITPFLSADNQTLYFATNGRDGLGSFDIYKSERLDDSWRNWSPPVNLGSQVNTPGRESSFVFLPGEGYAYFSSTRNSDGYGDIRRIRFNQDTLQQVSDIDTTQFVVKKDVEKMTGLRLINARSSETISGEVLLKMGAKVLRVRSDEKGKLPLDAGANGEIELKGFMTTSFSTYADSLLTVRLEPLEMGRTIRLSSVLFRRGTSEIMESSFEELERVVNMMKTNEEVAILLRGHTDANGDAEMNLKLSEERAKQVRKYLVSRGISRKRLSSVGLGGSEPVASNVTEQTRRLNRRVEFRIVR